MNTVFYSLGAAEEVTGSKHVLEIDGQSFLIDCGAFQGSRAEAERKNRNFGIASDRIEACILTHGQQVTGNQRTTVTNEGWLISTTSLSILHFY